SGSIAWDSESPASIGCDPACSAGTLDCAIKPRFYGRPASSMFHDSPAVRCPSIEWPTVVLVPFVYAAWLALTWFHEALPLWLWFPLAAWISAWWGSAQHEMVHGHPTRSRPVNTALATPPFWLWLPFERYRASHLDHHRDEQLTDPVADPETRYWAPEEWRALGLTGRLL